MTRKYIKKSLKIRDSIKKVKFLKEYFSKDRKQLNIFDATLWCEKNKSRLICGVCLFRKLQISDLAGYKECKNCFIYSEEYLQIYDYVEENSKSFVELYFEETITLSKFEEYVLRWQTKYSKIIQIHSYLGLLEKEYELYCKKPELLEHVLQLKKDNNVQKFEELYKENTKKRRHRRKIL